MSYKCEFILFETLTWGETEEGGGVVGAGCPDFHWKITSCHLFPRRKTGTNHPQEAI